MANWRVRLSGAQIDLEWLGDQVNSPQATISEDRGEYYLTSDNFQTMAEAEDVYRAANELLERVNMVAAFIDDGYTTVQMNSIVRTDENGKRKHFIFVGGQLSARGSLRASAHVVKPDGTVQADQAPSQFEVVLTLSKRKKAIADALRFYLKNDWASLYKVYEIIRDDVGGEAAITHRGWASRNQASRFRQTVQSPDALGEEARHATEKGHPPPRSPMSFSEAQSFIKRLLGKWVESKKR